MLMSALSEIHPDPDGFAARFNAAGIPDVRLERGKGTQNGIVGTQIHILVNGRRENGDMHEHHGHSHTHGGHHTHTSLSDIQALIAGLDVNKNVKKNAAAVYDLLAQAEAHVHGCEISDIHFHEVGTMDAVADIVGVCMLIDELGAENIIASPVNVGSGFVKCAHGILPVPAPAAAHLLCGIPIYSAGGEGERCTPTGAALLKHFVKKFMPMPVMTVEKYGCGAGTKQFETANILRVFFGEAKDSTDEIFELCCNIDDMTGEEMAYACEMLFKAGARDVFTVPVYMKKGRPAVMLCCICTQDEKDVLAKEIFRQTTTIGIRVHKCGRYVLKRSEESVSTPCGDIRVKTSEGYGVTRRKPEFEDIKKAAEASGLSLYEIKRGLDL